MKLALLADVHGNFEALKEVLAHVERHAADALLVCAGDMVGYGPDPEPCLDLLASRRAVMVAGNHEQMVIGRLGFDRCVHAGIASALWMREHLSSEATSLIADLPPRADAAPGVVVCHGDLENPETYVSTSERAQRALAQLAERRPNASVLVCGHTHRPMFYSRMLGLIEPQAGTTLALPPSRCVINPGSVGQERQTRRPVARYALLDLERRLVTYETLSYDHSSTIRKARANGLPPTVVMRPSSGLWRYVEQLRTRAARWSAVRAAQQRGQQASKRPTLLVAAAAVTYAPARLSRRALLAMQRGLASTGVPQAFAKTQPPRGATVLVYHAIVDVEESRWVDPRFSTPIDVFEAQMRFLSRRRNVIRLGDLLATLSREESPATGTVVITFDDGYRSVLERAAPILARYRLPFALYLATGLVSRRELPWIDLLFSSFNRRTRHMLDLREAGLEPMNLREPETVRRAYAAVENVLLVAQRKTRDELLAEIVSQLKPDRRPPRLTLNWDEVARLQGHKPGVDLGVHTRNHVDLTACSPSVAQEEVASSMQDLEQALSLKALDFAFPYGRSDTVSRAAVEMAGLRSAMVTDPPALVRVGSDILGLPRLVAPNDISMFSFFTSGAYPDVSLAVFGRA